jgi:hypothetical protein
MKGNGKRKGTRRIVAVVFRHPVALVPPCHELLAARGTPRGTNVELRALKESQSPLFLFLDLSCYFWIT